MEKLTKLDTDIAYVSSLSDYPNSVDGLTSEELKATFDKGSNDIKDFINNNLTEEIDAKFETVATKEEVKNVVLGQIPDGSITPEKLNEEVQTRIDKVDIVEENLNEIYNKAKLVTTYTVPRLLGENEGELVEAKSDIFGQIEGASGVETHTYAGKAIGNRTGEAIDFNISAGGQAIVWNGGNNYNNNLTSWNNVLKLTTYTNQKYIQYSESKNAAAYTWDLKEQRKATIKLNVDCATSNNSNIMTIYGSNDNESWDTLKTEYIARSTGDDIQNTDYIYTSEIPYRYYKVDFVVGGTSILLKVWYLYLTIEETVILGSLGNSMKIENADEMSNNQIVLIQVPTEIDTSKKEYYLNAIPIDTVLTKESYYELLYKTEDNKFYAKGVRA